MKNKGFTLVELVIVIVILGILAVVAIPKFVDLTGQAKLAATKGILGAVRSAVAIDYASYAASNNGSTQWPQTTAAVANAMSDGRIPNNAVNSLGTVKLVGTTSRAADSTYGWVYSSANGDFYAGNDVSW